MPYQYHSSAYESFTGVTDAIQSSQRNQHQRKTTADLLLFQSRAYQLLLSEQCFAFRRNHASIKQTMKLKINNTSGGLHDK